MLRPSSSSSATETATVNKSKIYLCMTAYFSVQLNVQPGGYTHHILANIEATQCVKETFHNRTKQNKINKK